MNVNQTLHQAILSKWSALINEQLSSCLNIKQWCLENNQSLYAFYYWKRILKEEYVKSIIPDIVPITPKTISSEPDYGLESRDLYNSCSHRLTESVSVSPKTVSVSIGDIKIDIGDKASDELISRIIKAVRYA